LDEKVEKAEADSMSSMLEGIMNGTMNADDFEKHIDAMVEDINQSGILPAGIDPHDADNIRKNTTPTEEELESPKTGLGVESLLLNDLASQLLKGGLANLVVKKQSKESFNELLEKAMKENPVLALAMLGGITDVMDDSQAALLKP
jgi:hypothetical protein